MLLLCFNGIDVTSIEQTYSGKFKEIHIDYSNLDNSKMIHYMEEIKTAMETYDVVAIKYSQEVQLCLDALNIEYMLVNFKELNSINYKYKDNYIRITQLMKIHKYLCIEEISELEQFLVNKYNWVNEQNVQDNYKVYVMNFENESDKNMLETSNKSETYLLNINDEQMSVKDVKKLTLQQVIDNDNNITEAEVREIKTITNKFKAVMILQAQSRLKTILKLLDVLDKLYDELVNRIDLSLTTADTASLMYTADYISKALSDTNQFIMSMITNEKIQNFFIIDNSNIINISDDRLSIDKREKIRKAAEIVLENTEYFASGDFDKVVDPNNDGGNENVS